MIDPPLLLAFIAAVTVLMLIPGPNVALIVANSMAYGPRYGLLTVAGTSSAVIVQLGLTGLGLAGLLGTAGGWLEWVRWLGAAYLVGLGITQWRARPPDLARLALQPRSVRAVYMRALLVSLTNPKTLLFYGAFFPQFISRGHDVGRQMALLAATFLLLAVLIDSGWALVAGRARALLVGRARLRNRLAGGLLIGAGIGLAMTRSR